MPVGCVLWVFSGEFLLKAVAVLSSCGCRCMNEENGTGLWCMELPQKVAVGVREGDANSPGNVRCVFRHVGCCTPVLVPVHTDAGAKV